MRPVLFHLAGWPVEAYGFFLAVGAVGALLLLRCLAKTRGVPLTPLVDALLVALFSGLIGARIGFVLLQPAYFAAHPAEIFSFWNGGLVFYGGFLFALVPVALFLRSRRLALAKAFDVIAPCLALAQAFGRIGCFFAGCCFGTYCSYPWAVRLGSPLTDTAFRGHGIHPVQLYEAVGLFLLTGMLTKLASRPKQPPAGSITAAYVMGYAALRFITEFFRADEIRGTVSGTPWSYSQLIAAVLFLLGGSFLARALRRDQ